MALPTPSFYDPKRISEVYIERAGVVAKEARTFRDHHNIAPAGQDDFRIAAFGIDCQIGFIHPEASLCVPGAIDDTQRTLEWIYRNLDRLTGLHFSMDTHRVFQIFHPAWWTDPDGKHPEPLTPITYDDVKGGKWKPLAHPREALEYCKQLEATGKC